MIEKNKIIMPIAAGFTNDRVIENVINEINSKNLSSVEILDLGTGHGYNADKLLKSSVGNKIKITCVDMNKDLFHMTENEKVKFITYNLNEDFNFGKFDFVITTETMEHLENPYHFSRNCIANLKQDGILYVSAPNASNIYSAIKIFINGTPHCFGELEEFGHISPIFPFMFKFILAEAEKKYGKKLKLDIFYNKNVLKLYPSKLEFWLPGHNSRLIGQISIYKIRFD